MIFGNVATGNYFFKIAIYFIYFFIFQLEIVGISGNITVITEDLYDIFLLICFFISNKLQFGIFTER